MPLDWSDVLEVLFLKNYNTRLVILGTALLGLSSGLVGTLLLLRKRSLFGDALSHATLPGIGVAFAVAVSLGWDAKSLPLLLTGAALSGLAGVAVLLVVRRTTRLRDDVAMGLVLSVFFGVGTAVLSMVQTLPGANAAGLESFIYGKTASMVAADVGLIAGVSGVAVLVVLTLRKEFTLLCFDEGYAAATGWPVLFLDVLVLGLVTGVTVVGLQAVGLVLVIAFLIIPAAAARFWTESLPVMMALSALLGALSGWLGAGVSALFANLPAGAVIVLSAAFFFALSLVFGRRRGLWPRVRAAARLKRRVGRQHLLRAAYEILEGRGRPVRNAPFGKAELMAHRSWTPRRLAALLRQARREDHLERTPVAGELRLSESGFGEGARITRNHRLWELYLIRHAEIAPSHVDRDADLVEHVLGAELVHALEAELETHHTEVESPHEIS
ncbi:MAG: iron chelate uptake ABC transporter family permease subunit [Verrucomicrobiales bacterium]